MEMLNIYTVETQNYKGEVIHVAPFTRFEDARDACRRFVSDAAVYRILFRFPRDELFVVAVDENDGAMRFMKVDV